jgi:hypothetical protein
MHIKLHIEELVLRGIDVKHRARVAQSVQDELVRLLTDRGLSPALSQGVAIRQARAPGFQLAAGGGDEKLAGQVAQSIHGALAR